jgi:hypothetical protein
VNADELRSLRDRLRVGIPPTPGRGACTTVALEVAVLTGWPAVTGDFDDPRADRMWVHSWNVRSDGWIVDVTSDQFGYDDLLICPPCDNRAARYQQIAWL